jgi:hypothetical protein
LDDFSIRIEGVSEVADALDAMSRNIDVATVAALKASQNLAKKAIRSGMRGRPRYDRRGAIGRNGSVPAVNLNLSPHHVAKSAGPGRLTGHLSGAVGGVRKPKKTSAGFSGGVGVGGKQSITNLYRREVNAKFPFIEPGVRKAQAGMPAIWEKAWDKAIHY